MGRGGHLLLMHFHLPISQFIHQEMTVSPMLPVSQIRLLKCNRKFMVKFQAAEHARETFAAALIGAQKGSKTEARTEPAQTSPKPIFHLASHLSKKDKQQTSWSMSLQLHQNLPLWIKLDGLLAKARVLIMTDIIQKSTKIGNLIYMLAVLRIVDEQQTRFSDLSSLILMHFHYQKTIPKTSRKYVLLQFLKFSSSECKYVRFWNPYLHLWCLKMWPQTNLHLTNNTNFHERT